MPESLLISSGELRTTLLTLLEHFDVPNKLMLSFSNHVGPSDIATRVANAPWKPFSSSSIKEAWGHTLEFFRASVDDLPQSTEWEQRIQSWICALNSGQLEAKFWPTAPLFSRLISRAESSIVLSEPLHEQLDNSQHELRIELRGEEHHRARDWFHSRFAEGLPVSQEIAQVLRDSWAGSLISAEDAYLKVLSEYFSPVIRGIDVEIDDNPMLQNLANFQRAAYEYAKSILRRYGGVFLADVVGLGKTYIALALLSHLHRRYNESAVVVAPPKVLPAWEELAKEFRIEIACVSIGKLEELNNYSDREVVVIDESHGFRHQATERYSVLAKWLRPNGEPSTRKVLLLSATPQNNSPDDIRHQLALFPDTYLRLPFRGETLEAWFRDVKSSRARLVDLLQHVVVRRTRGFIAQAYPDAVLRRRIGPAQYVDEPLQFPVRKSGPEQCLRYSIGDTYHNKMYERILLTLERLKYPLHGLATYLKTEYANDPQVEGLRRAGTSIRGLFKVLLLKRLESSVSAFRKTVARLEQKLKAASEKWKSGVVSIVCRRSATSEDDEDNAFLDDERTVPKDLFDERLIRDIFEDLSEVRSIAGIVQELGPNEDAKLQRLREYLNHRKPREHRTLVFTQFVDTAEYLGANLQFDFGRTAVVTGARSGILQTARRFAPKANRVNIAEEDELDLLISTDLLSEGVNLQDADTIVNYDLHWNPVRLIQRAGRIDRIGTMHAEIHVASFLPERELEADLHIEEVVRRRIREFVQVFGEDHSVLPGDELASEETILKVCRKLGLLTGIGATSAIAGSHVGAMPLRLRRSDRNQWMRRLSSIDVRAILS